MTIAVNSLRPLNHWINMVAETGSPLHKKLYDICGDNGELKKQATVMCLCALKAFADRYGPDRSVMIIRSSGRVNLVGTHIDHRGGSVNPIAVKHMWLVVEPRDDDMVLAKNVEADYFPDEQFRISDCLPAGEKIVTMSSRSAEMTRR